MFKQFSTNAGKAASVLVLCLMAFTMSLRGQNGHEGKVMGGYFEEWRSEEHTSELQSPC